MSNSDTPWQPDHRRLGNWAEMFDSQARNAPPPAQSTAPETEAPGETEPLGIDSTEYRPWQLQRGRSRPPFMLALRRFDLKAGHWRGWSMAYPGLFTVEHVGDRMVTLGFSTAQFAVEGRGLDILADHLQQGIVLQIVEYALPIWPTRVDGPIVSTIRRILPEL